MTAAVHKLALTLAAALVVGGLGLKLARYGARHNAAHAGGVDAPATVTEAMARAGWRRTLIQSGPRIPFPSLRFEKAGCPRPVVVSILGRGAELVPLARMVHGDDMLLSGGYGGQLLLVISPASALGHSACNLPPSEPTQRLLNTSART